MRTGRPSLRDTRKRRWVELHTQHWWSEKEGGGSPCAAKGQKGLLWAAAFTFFSVISLSLPPNLSLPHSAEESASSKETLVDSRKSGCCRSDKNLVGVSVWVEPAEEQRWLHHSSLSPKDKKGLKKKTKQKNKTSNTHIQRHTYLHTHTYSPCWTSTKTQWKTWRLCKSDTRVDFKDESCSRAHKNSSTLKKNADWLAKLHTFSKRHRGIARLQNHRSSRVAFRHQTTCYFKLKSWQAYT